MLDLHKILLEYNVHCSILFCNTIAIQSWFLFQTNIFSFEILESICKWKDCLKMIVFFSMWWFKGKTWRTQTFFSYKILLKIRWKVQWRLHQQTTKTFQMYREKGKSKALAYKNLHIGSLRMYFAYRECPKLFTYLETKASAKTGKKKRHKHKVLIFSVCAKKCGLRPDKTWTFW